jgi:hypothetical protein
LFGKILGQLITTPIRLVNLPLKMAQRTAEAADKFMLGDNATTYRAPKKNVLDHISDAIEEVTEDTLG